MEQDPSSPSSSPESPAPGFWERAQGVMDQSIAEEQERLASKDLPDSERPQYQLQLKAFEAERELVMARDESAWRDYHTSMEKGEQFFDIVPEDIIYSDDRIPGEGQAPETLGEQALRVKAIDTAKKILLVEGLDETDAKGAQELKFEDLLTAAPFITKIDKLHHQKKLGVTESLPSRGDRAAKNIVSEPKQTVSQGKGWQDEIIDAEFESVAPRAGLESSQKRIEYQASEVERRGGPQGPRPQWKVTAEPAPRTREDHERIEKRKAWLGAMFSAGQDSLDLGVSKSGLVKNIRSRLHRPITPGMPTMLDKSLGNDKTALAAAGLLDRLEREKVSLRDLFGQAKTFQDFRALKVLGAALLEGAMDSNGQRSWGAMNEQQKSFARLGELIGLEAERRQIELSGGKMEKDVAARAYKRYMGMVDSADVPDFFRERFRHTAEALQEGYKLPKREERVAQPAQEVADVPGREPIRTVEVPSFEIAGAIIGGERTEINLNEMTGSQLEVYAQALRQRKEELVSSSPAVRQLEQGLSDDRFDYPPTLIDQLKESYRSADVKTDRYRQKFIDNLSEQMRYCQFQNNNPTRLDKIVRGFIDGVGARWQVFGLRSIFRPFKTAKELQAIRREVSNSFSPLTATPLDKNFVAYHVAELGLANANEVWNERREVKDIYDIAAESYKGVNATIYDLAGESYKKPEDSAVPAQPDIYETAAESYNTTLRPIIGLSAAQEAEIDVRRAEQVQARESTKLRVGMQRWIIKNPGRDLLRWKAENVYEIPTWQRYVKAMGTEEARVWADMVAQVEEQRRRRVA